MKLKGKSELVEKNEKERMEVSNWRLNMKPRGVVITGNPAPDSNTKILTSTQSAITENRNKKTLIEVPHTTTHQPKTSYHLIKAQTEFLDQVRKNQFKLNKEQEG